jgi:acetyl-CoA carboxylase carboxyltransferase component
MFITGPQVIKTVTGEDVSAEDLGGALSNNVKSGNAHFMGKNDTETLMMVRDLLSYFPSNNMETPPVYAATDSPNRLIPEFEDIIPENPNKAYDMYEIIKGIADDGIILDVAEYAKSIITCFIRLMADRWCIANQPKVEAGCLNINLRQSCTFHQKMRRV